MEKNQRKKASASRIFAYIISMLIGAVAGILFVMMPDVDGTNRLVGLFIKLVFFYGGFVLHIILHEAGHLVGGLLSGYRFSSFRIFNIIWMKKDGKLIAKKYNIPGTGGQCLMTPPPLVDGKYPYLLYNLGGGLANFLWCGVFFVFYLLLRNGIPYADSVLIPLACIGILCGAMNLIPLRMSGVANDGYNIMLLSKSPAARQAFHIGFSANASLMEGVRYQDMPVEWFALPEHFNDAIAATAAILRFNYFLDQHDFSTARELAQKILVEGDNILELQRNELRCDLLLIELIGERRPEEIEKLYTPALKKYIKASTFHLSKCLLMYAYHKLVTQDQEEVEKALAHYRKIYLTSPYQGELALNHELMEIVDGIKV